MTDWKSAAAALLASVTTLGAARGAPTSPVVSNDWPQLYFDTQHSSYNPYETTIGPTNVASLKVAWKRGVPCTIRLGVMVVEDIAYYGHYCGEFLAVDAATGATIWTKSLSGKHQGHAIVDGVAYVSSLNRIYAFDALTGSPLWQWDGGNSYFGNPWVADGVVVVNSSTSDALHALDAATGTELWTLSGNRSVAIDSGILYCTAPTRLEARTLSTGTLLWTGLIAAGTSLSGPTVANGKVYVHSDAGELYVFDANGCGGARCTPLWTGTTHPNVAEGPQRPAVAEGVVYLGAAGAMYAFDADGCGGPTCAPLWTSPTACSFSPGSSPSVANGVVYTTCDNSYLYAFDAATGAILWQYYTQGSGYPMRSSPTIVDGRLYHAATFDFTLYVFEIPYDYDGLGNPYCFPAVPNSSGQSARIAAYGSDVVGDNNFLLNATDMPQHQLGYFLASQTQGFVPQPPGSVGNLCLGGTIGRFAHQVQDSGVPGSFSIQVDLTQVPTYPPSAVLAGETWNFQAWFRDGPAQSSNFTDGVSVTFQ